MKITLVASGTIRGLKGFERIILTNSVPLLDIAYLISANQDYQALLDLTIFGD